MAGPYQDGFTPGAPGISWGVNGGGTGNSGSSEKAAREDHIHPLNVNTNYMPIPVGGGIQNIINVSGSGHPGSIGLDKYRTMAYALANHVHAYLFCDYLGREGSTITGPSRDGVAYGSFSISTYQYNQGISAGVNGALGAETSAPNGSVGKALFPARADHSHPLNVPPSGDTTSKTKSIGSENKNGSSSYYARLDHEHTLLQQYTYQSGWFVQSLVDGGSNTTLHYRPCIVHTTGLVEITGETASFDMPSARLLESLQQQLSSLAGQVGDLENTVNDIINSL